tara:strand:+ start:488 stop:595 length:108 start_codon:yes stop_codon:yes gene_type:complete
MRSLIVEHCHPFLLRHLCAIGLNLGLPQIGVPLAH